MLQNETTSEKTEGEHGEILLYQTEGGKTALEVHLRDESVWLTQKQLSSLFQTDRSVVTKHIANIFRTGELDQQAVCAKFAHTAADGKTYRTNYYNLDVIIAVGYRVNAKRGTQFRIWATSILRDHLVHGYTLNQRRLREKGTAELQEALTLLTGTLENHNLISDEGRAVLDVVNRYAKTWQILLQYDEDNLPLPTTKHDTRSLLGIEYARRSYRYHRRGTAVLWRPGSLSQRRGKGGAPPLLRDQGPSLGIHETIDYASIAFEDVVHDADVVLDTMGGEVWQRSWKVLKKGGIMVSTLRGPEAEGVDALNKLCAHVFVQPDTAQLGEIAVLIDNGHVRPEIARVFPLEEAAQAHREIEGGHTRGKIVLDMTR